MQYFPSLGLYQHSMKCMVSIFFKMDFCLSTDNEGNCMDNLKGWQPPKLAVFALGCPLKSVLTIGFNLFLCLW